MAGTRTVVEIGSKWGRWEVLRESVPDKHRRRRFECRCACGATRVVAWAHLRMGVSRSCGCLHKEILAGKATHGYTRVRGGDKYHRLMYVAWQGIKSRCRNPKASNYRWYGAVGVDICDEWHDSFAAFIGYLDANLGKRPDGWSLDRIRPEGMYEPGNVRWASPMQQRHNRRKLPTAQ